MVHVLRGILSVKFEVLGPYAFVLVEAVLGVQVAVDGECFGAELLDDVATRQRD